MGADRSSAIIEFGEDTTIHGIREIVTRKYSKTLNIIWLLFFLAAVFVACFLLTYTTKEYLDSPTATDLSFSSINQFAPFVFCPEIWVKDEAANQIGYTKDMNTYIQTMMLQSPTKFFWTTTSDPKKAYGDADWDAVRTSLEQLLTSKNLTIGSLLTTVSYSVGELAAYVDTDSSTDYNADRIENAVGMCYAFRDNREFDNFTVERALLAIEFRSKTSDLVHTTKIPRSHANYFFLGAGAVAALPENSYAISTGKSYEIKITIMKVKKDSSSGECSETVTMGERNTCITDCFSRKCAAAGMCEVYFPGNPEKNLSRYCTYLETGNHCAMQDSSGSHDCADECLKPCSFPKVSLSVMPFEAEDLTDGEARIVVSLYSPTMILFMNEYPSFTMATLFCNLGGVISLFVGCSIMSLVHAVCFFAIKGCNRLKH